jgi:hypothetical protein
MHLFALKTALVIAAGLGLSQGASHSRDLPQDDVQSDAPCARLANGTYVGVRNDQYAQDLFLGIPYAQPPVGALRFASPQGLNEVFEEPRLATEYGLMCIGYGSDTSNLGNPVSEDCLTLNIVRPAGVQAGDDLPVGVWVHGGVSELYLCKYSYGTDNRYDRVTCREAHATLDII